MKKSAGCRSIIEETVQPKCVGHQLDQQRRALRGEPEQLRPDGGHVAPEEGDGDAEAALEAAAHARGESRMGAEPGAEKVPHTDRVS